MTEENSKTTEHLFSALIDLMAEYRTVLKKITDETRVCVLIREGGAPELETGSHGVRRPSAPGFTENASFLSTARDALSGHEQIHLAKIEREIPVLAARLGELLRGKIEYVKINLIGTGRLVSTLREKDGDDDVIDGHEELGRKLRLLAGA